MLFTAAELIGALVGEFEQTDALEIDERLALRLSGKDPERTAHHRLVTQLRAELARTPVADSDQSVGLWPGCDGIDKDLDGIALAVELFAAVGAQVTVADTGQGLPSDFHLEARDRLGLQIVRTLATGELRGEITLRARPGGGTEAVLEVPLHRGAGGSVSSG